MWYESAMITIHVSSSEFATAHLLASRAGLRQLFQTFSTFSRNDYWWHILCDSFKKKWGVDPFFGWGEGGSKENFKFSALSARAPQYWIFLVCVCVCFMLYLIVLYTGVLVGGGGAWGALAPPPKWYSTMTYFQCTNKILKEIAVYECKNATNF